MKIRKFQPSDLDAVLDSWEIATRLAHKFMTDTFIAQERKNIIDIYLPNTNTWVADIGGQAEGFISLIGNEVGALFLQPRFHGKGIGTTLMNKARELHGNLEVDVFVNNAIGRRFYTNYGFKYLQQKWHKETGQQLIRLKYTAI